MEKCSIIVLNLKLSLYNYIQIQISNWQNCFTLHKKHKMVWITLPKDLSRKHSTVKNVRLDGTFVNKGSSRTISWPEVCWNILQVKEDSESTIFNHFPLVLQTANIGITVCTNWICINLMLCYVVQHFVNSKIIISNEIFVCYISNFVVDLNL